jgi:hypothetical protein
MAQPTPHVREDLLDQYAMATLPERSAAEVEEHLLSCSLCQKRLVETDEFLTVSGRQQLKWTRVLRSTRSDGRLG